MIQTQNKTGTENINSGSFIPDFLFLDNINIDKAAGKEMSPLMPTLSLTCQGIEEYDNLTIQTEASVTLF